MIREDNVKQYCNEDVSLIENYEQAKNDTVMWVCHHRLETHNSDGERRLYDITKKELIALGMYYKRPASELIFLTISEHRSIHKTNKGHTYTQEQKDRLSNSLLEYYKSIDEDYQKDRIKKIKPIYDMRARKISNTMSERRAVYVQFDTNTPWGRILTTKQIANLNGSKASGKVKQYIDKYGYVNILHTRYYCKIIQTDRIGLI